ncbi:hypothetical protein FAIPA1_10323 [Frankia sp. AiPs1]
MLSLYAKGLTTGEISAHFEEIYDQLSDDEDVGPGSVECASPARWKPARYSGSGPSDSGRVSALG